MGEITETIELYIENSDILEEKTQEISNTLETNIKEVISPGSVGYDTGHLHDNIYSSYAISGPIAVIVAAYGPDYGQYWYRWKGGEDFLNKGLEDTLALYR